jgi:alpha,alpha-trehalose phosphorylase
VIEDPAFGVEPWTVREEGLDLDALARTESLFALSNGHVGLRGNLDEAEPHVVPGTYLNGFYELRPLPYAEAGYGYPESGQTLVNVTDGKVIRALIDDEPFDVRYGNLLQHERVLDLRAGVLRRRVEWCSPAGQGVRITSTRLVSFAQRAVAAILWEVEPLQENARVVAQSELVANEPLPHVLRERDPRAAAALDMPLGCEYFANHRTRAVLVHRTKSSGLRIAAAMDHLIDGPPGTEWTSESFEDIGRLTVAANLDPGERLRIVKFVAYGWSSQRSLPALRAQVGAALAEAHHTGWEGLVAAQRAFLDEFWACADVEIEGDEEIQQALRFALFHVLQAGARAEGRAIPAKGLTGPGYDGHAFWDSETFALPLLMYTLPKAAADALRWRHGTLGLARERARLLGLSGAAFPWRTIHGEECSGYWPAGTAAFHVNAGIADAVTRYRAVTGDEEFEREVGLELLVETARVWLSLGHHDGRSGFRIDGPDEYSALGDNNVFTNLMAQRNLRAAAEAVGRDQLRAAELGVYPGEPAAWLEAADAMVIPYDAKLGVHPQSEGFTLHAVWDFGGTPPDHYPLLLHYPYFDLYRKQVAKQADLVLALHLCGDAFTPEEKLRNFEYYEPLTVRDSSLSSSTQAVVAAEVGHLELAWAYLCEASLVDLRDLQGNSRDGVHIASLAGAWSAAVAGLGGMRDHGGRLTFAPRLPAALTGLTFGLEFRGRRLRVEARPGEATYTLLRGEPLALAHHGEPLTVALDAPVTLAIPPRPERPAPRQPPGREPLRREGAPAEAEPEAAGA